VRANAKGASIGDRPKCSESKSRRPRCVQPHQTPSRRGRSWAAPVARRGSSTRGRGHVRHCHCRLRTHHDSAWAWAPVSARPVDRARDGAPRGVPSRWHGCAICPMRCKPKGRCRRGPVRAGAAPTAFNCGRLARHHSWCHTQQHIDRDISHSLAVSLAAVLSASRARGPSPLLPSTVLIVCDRVPQSCGLVLFASTPSAHTERAGSTGIAGEAWIR
jgi:hypothetical protein